MTDPVKPSVSATASKPPLVAPAATTAEATKAKSDRPADELSQEQDIKDRRAEDAMREQEIRDAARTGNVQSLEGARPEFEPPIGEGPRPFPDGLVVGGPVLNPDERAFIADPKRNPNHPERAKPSTMKLPS